MKHDADTEIQFSGLKSGVYHYDFTLDDSFFSTYKNEKILHAAVVYAVQLDKKEGMLLFRFDFHGTVTTQCDRCLAEVDIPVEGSNELCVKFSDTETSDEEDLVYLPVNESRIDLAQWMYEYVAVSLPIQCVHPEGDDGEPTCDPEMIGRLRSMQATEDSGNAEKEMDPRWNALAQLKTENKQ